jgi:hypothetical protein
MINPPSGKKKTTADQMSLLAPEREVSFQMDLNTTMSNIKMTRAGMLKNTFPKRSNILNNEIPIVESI